MDVQEQLWSALSIFIAMILGGLVGLERELKEKPIGLRTNMLVAGSSALFVLLGKGITAYMGSGLAGLVEADPIRVIQAIVVGISFIGAGTVIKSGEARGVKFLTTAATILFSAGIGIAVAIGQLILAVLVTLMAWITNFVLKRYLFP